MINTKCVVWGFKLENITFLNFVLCFVGEVIRRVKVASRVFCSQTKLKKSLEV